MESLINEGNSGVRWGSQLLSHQKIFLRDDIPPGIDAETFKDLPHFGWDKNAPVHQSLSQSNYFFRFRFPPENKWMLGRKTSDRRIINCWKTEFPPFVCHREEFVNDFVRESFNVTPDLSGKYGTLVGSKLITCALDAVPEEVLWEWLEHKEKQRLGGQYA